MALPDLTPAQMREDLVFLRDDWFRQDKSFSPEHAAEFQALVSEGLERADEYDAVSFWMQVSRAVSRSRNGHTNVNADDPPFPGLPFMAWWFRDGLHVVKAAPPYAHLLGARVERIGTQDATRAVASVAPYIAGIDRRIRVVSPRYLRIPALLHRLGITASDSEARLTFRLTKGSQEEIVLPAEMSGDPGQADSEEWGVLIPSEPRIPGRWLHVLDTVRSRPAIYRDSVDVDYEWLSEGHRILYIRSNRVAGSGDEDMSLTWKLMGLIMTEVVPNAVQVVVVDLRLNSGGNFGNAILFAQALPRVLSAEARVYVLVSGSTFSAAIVTAAMLKDSGGPRVTLVGSKMGDTARFWAEGSRVCLPNSKLSIKPSWGLQDWEEAGLDLARYFWANVVWGPRQRIDLSPEIEIESTFEEYQAGRDPALERVLATPR